VSNQYAKRHQEMRDNLLAVYYEGTEAEYQMGREWYPKAQKIVSEWSDSYNVTEDTVACVIAAISPQCDWVRNLIIADDILAERQPSIGGIWKNIGKAHRLLMSDGGLHTVAERMREMFPSGPKVKNFALNLSGHMDAVTVDAHALQAALYDPLVTKGLHTSAYNEVASIYREAAERVGLDPATFQATVWVIWKRLYPKAEKKRLGIAERQRERDR
jgi:hypothetical protein